ncbi:hypothetical protein DFH08DRAFT_937762 [Mycena albidolilacea]|uniref:Uncharacterized protein n=1 Tax=Mycena albidolilacea TaxID=1033008 RepID=A0AAD6ZYE4_9AGAR|nr:hypothetical protein DFH08DRAFT_937762 [Mycena albidolilacea]
MRESSAWRSPLAADEESVRGYGSTSAGHEQGLVDASSEGTGAGADPGRRTQRASLVVRARADALRTGGGGAHGRRAGDVVKWRWEWKWEWGGVAVARPRPRGAAVVAGALEQLALRPQRRLVHLARADEQPHVGLRTHFRVRLPVRFIHARQDPALELLAPFLRRAAHPQNPARRLYPSSAGRRPREPQAPWADVAPARRARVLHSAPGSGSPQPPSFEPGTLQDPSIRGTRPPSSLLNPPSSLLNSPSSLLNSPSAFGAARAAAAAAVACPHGWERGWWGRGKEGGPAAPRVGGVAACVALDAVNERMESAATFATMESVDEAREGQAGDVGEWPPSLPSSAVSNVLSYIHTTLKRHNALAPLGAPPPASRTRGIHARGFPSTDWLSDSSNKSAGIPLYMIPDPLASRLLLRDVRTPSRRTQPT